MQVDIGLPCLHVVQSITPDKMLFSIKKGMIFPGPIGEPLKLETPLILLKPFKTFNLA